MRAGKKKKGSVPNERSVPPKVNENGGPYRTKRRYGTSVQGQQGKGKAEEEERIEERACPSNKDRKRQEKEGGRRRKAWSPFLDVQYTGRKVAAMGLKQKKRVAGKRRQNKNRKRGRG